MNKLMNSLIDTVADKLTLQKKAVKRWVKRNNYSSDQLTTLCKQITYNETPLSTLVGSIINNSEYRINI